MEIGPLIKKLGLPENAEFLGYTLHLVDSDEFLAIHESNEIFAKLGWIRNPEKALLFKNAKKALQIRKNDKPEANVVHVWDIGTQLVVTLLD